MKQQAHNNAHNKRKNSHRASIFLYAQERRRNEMLYKKATRDITQRAAKLIKIIIIIIIIA
jgi:hypothetical protein